MARKGRGTLSRSISNVLVCQASSTRAEGGNGPRRYRVPVAASSERGPRSVQRVVPRALAMVRSPALKCRHHSSSLAHSLLVNGAANLRRLPVRDPSAVAGQRLGRWMPAGLEFTASIQRGAVAAQLSGFTDYLAGGPHSHCALSGFGKEQGIAAKPGRLGRGGNSTARLVGSWMGATHSTPAKPPPATQELPARHPTRLGTHSRPTRPALNL